MKAEKTYVKMDLKKIFFTFPKGLFERVITLIFAVIVFAIFFGPLLARIDPLRGAISALVPTLTTSWGLLVLTRSLFLKTAYMKTDE